MIILFKLLTLWKMFAGKLPRAETLESTLVQAVQSKTAITEQKLRVGKAPQEFTLENWLHCSSERHMLPCVGRWVNPNAASYSWGVWWADSDVGIYRMHDRHGNLLAYRFDVLKDVRIFDQRKVPVDATNNQIDCNMRSELALGSHPMQSYVKMVG